VAVIKEEDKRQARKVVLRVTRIIMRGIRATKAKMDEVLNRFMYLIGNVVRVLLPLNEPYGVFN
jgi:hypothetical protein